MGYLAVGISFMVREIRPKEHPFSGRIPPTTKRAAAEQREAFTSPRMKHAVGIHAHAGTRKARTARTISFTKPCNGSSSSSPSYLCGASLDPALNISSVGSLEVDTWRGGGSKTKVFP